MKPRPVTRFLWALAATMTLACAKRPADMEWDYAGDGASYDGAYADEAPMAEAEAASVSSRSARPPAQRKRAKRTSAAPPASPDRFVEMAMEPPVDAPAPDDDPAPDDRMVHYDGHARLRVAQVAEAQDQLTALAAEVGGLVEHQYGTAMTLRVPVARFDETFARVLAVGDVMDKRITATDVTDSFVATELRLRTARTTRARLVELLAKAEDEQDKLFLVREIQRITEVIDQLEGQSRTLSALASMSRITAELVPRARVTWADSGREVDELQWIRALSPFRRSVAASGWKLELPVPEGMVDLQAKKQWVVESADGARAWSGRLPNAPEGDAAFWLAALQERLAPEFASATPDAMGGFTTLRLVSRDDQPYVWVIGVRVRGNRLDLVEAFSPSIEHERRHGPAVRAALENAKARPLVLWGLALAGSWVG